MQLNFSHTTLRTNIGEYTLEYILHHIEFVDIFYQKNSVKNYLSSYRTFFDGVNFYYDSYFLSNYTDIQQQQIVLNEILNFASGYFISSRKMLDSQIIKAKNINLIALSHLGVVKNKVWYSQSYRKNLIERYIAKYGKSDVILFTPNDNARQYLYNLIGTEHNFGILTPIDQIIKSKTLTYCNINDAELHVTQYSGINIANRDFHIPFKLVIRDNNGKLIKKVNEEFFQYVVDNNIIIADNGNISRMKLDENTIDKYFELFDSEIISNKNLSRKFIMKHLKNLNLTRIIRNSQDLDVEFIENEIIKPYLYPIYVGSKNYGRYENFMIELLNKYTLNSDFISKYYTSKHLICELLYSSSKQLPMDADFWDKNFNVIPSYKYYDLLKRKLSYDFVLKYLDKLTESEKQTIRLIQEHQYQYFTNEQKEHFDSIIIMEELL